MVQGEHRFLSDHVVVAQPCNVQIAAWVRLRL
jgi:hypothetical protein